MACLFRVNKAVVGRPVPSWVRHAYGSLLLLLFYHDTDCTLICMHRFSYYGCVAAGRPRINNVAAAAIMHKLRRCGR